MQLTNRFFYISILLGIYAFSLMIQELLFLNWDVASLLYATKLLLGGGRYVSDIFTPNPPMILYLYTPPVMFSKLFNLDIIVLFRVYVYLLCTASLVMCYTFVKDYFSQQERNLTGLFMATLAIAYLVLPTYEFGNRDHLLLVLSMPYLLAVVSRLRGNKLDPKYAMLIGLLAGAGFAIKPQFLVTLALVELYGIYFQKNVLAWWRVETLTIAVVLLTYAATMFLFHANFIYIIVPFLMRNYYSAISLPLKFITYYPFTVFCLMTSVFYLLWQHNKKQELLFTVLFIALMGFVLSIYLQHTLFYYHFLPALSIALLLSVMMFYLFASSVDTCFIDTVKIALLVTAFTAIDAYLYYSTWVYMVFYPWYFYAFFACLFTLLFYTIKTNMTVLSVFIRVCFIVMVGVLCSLILIESGYFTHRFLFLLLLMPALYVLFAMQFYRNFIHHALVAALAISMFYVPLMQEYYVYLGPRQYKGAALNKLAAFINARGPDQSIYVFSAAIYYTFPTVFYAHARPAQRFDQLWPILGFSKQIFAKGEKPSLEYSQDKKFIVDMVAEDLHRNKPDLIFIDNGHILGGNFDYVVFFSDNANFRKEWKSYRYLTTLPLGMMNLVDTNMPVYERIKN